VSFGLTVTLDWWQWLLMVFGAGFCWAAGAALGGAFVRALGAMFSQRRQPPG